MISVWNIYFHLWPMFRNMLVNLNTIAYSTGLDAMFIVSIRYQFMVYTQRASHTSFIFNTYDSDRGAKVIKKKTSAFISTLSLRLTSWIRNPIDNIHGSQIHLDTIFKRNPPVSSKNKPRNLIYFMSEIINRLASSKNRSFS